MVKLEKIIIRGEKVHEKEKLGTWVLKLPPKSYTIYKLGSLWNKWGKEWEDAYLDITQNVVQAWISFNVSETRLHAVFLFWIKVFSLLHEDCFHLLLTWKVQEKNRI